MTTPNTNTKELYLLEQIMQHLEKSHALNGGFDRLVATVNHIKERQDETADKVAALGDRLYEPTTGVFARMQSIEANQQADRQSLEHIDTQVTNLLEQQQQDKETQQTTAALKKIAGENLQEIEYVVNAKKQLAGYYRKSLAAAVVAIGSSIAKLLWDTLHKTS